MFSKKLNAIILTLCLIITLTLPAGAVGNSPLVIPGDIVIFHTNDTHGYIKADDASKTIGHDTIAAMKEAYADRALLLDAGDVSNGQPFAAKTKGESAITVMNAAGYDAMTIGNHEFDFTDNIERLMDAADFPFLSANIRKKADGGLLAESAAVFTVNGAKVGVFGVTTPETAWKVNPENVAEYSFGDFESVAADAEKTASELRAQGCDIVIALTHLGLLGEYTSTKLAERLDGKIDVMIDGHSHSAPDKNAKTGGVWVISTGGENNGGYGTIVGYLSFSKSASGGYELAEPGYIDFDTARASFTPKPEVTAMIEELNAPVYEMEKNIVASLKNDLNGERADMRSKETDLGNTAADAVCAFASADIALLNGGGFRASLKAGDLTEKDLFSVFPFGNVIYKTTVKGGVIREMLESGVSMVAELGGRYPQVSGIRFAFDPSKEPGQRILFAVVDGRPLDDDAQYTLATNDYLAAGGDGYTMLAEPFKNPLAYTPLESAEGISVLSDILAWHLKETNGGTAAIEGRSVSVENGRALTRGEFTDLVNKRFGFTQPDEVSFLDVPENHPYTAAVAIAKKAGYLIGSGGGFCNPDADITGAQLAVITARLLEIDTSGGGSWQPEWAAGAVMALNSRGLMPLTLAAADKITPELAKLFLGANLVN